MRHSEEMRRGGRDAADQSVLLPPPGSYPYYPNEAGPSGAGAVAGVGAGAGDYYDYGVRPGGRV